MGKTRIDFHNKLVNLLGSSNVYYQPPENLKLQYPAIVYSKTRKTNAKADNIKYLNHNRYEVIVIDRLPDNIVIDKLLELEYSHHDRHYVSDNLHHDAIEIYY
ncbi:MAG: hypothetical protein II625_03520 [Bacilli bacterium]|nr:hypothetical protein [Bacilli bacterium]